MKKTQASNQACWIIIIAFEGFVRISSIKHTRTSRGIFVYVNAKLCHAKQAIGGHRADNTKREVKASRRKTGGAVRGRDDMDGIVSKVSAQEVCVRSHLVRPM